MNILDCVVNLSLVLSIYWFFKTFCFLRKLGAECSSEDFSMRGVIGEPISAEISVEQQITRQELPIACAEIPKQSVTPMIPQLDKTKVTFNHLEIQLFYEKHIAGNPFLGGQVLKGAIEILSYLDASCNCSSLENYKYKYCRRGKKSSYDIYASVKLWEHSLHVAEEIIFIINANNKQHIQAKAIIAALGHDIGKSKQLSDVYKNIKYENHQTASVRILEGMRNVSNIYCWQEVKEAILLHHQKSNKLLNKALVGADQAARRRELNAHIDHAAIHDHLSAQKSVDKC